MTGVSEAAEEAAFKAVRSRYRGTRHDGPVKVALFGAAPQMAADERERLRGRLREHYLAQVICDHERKMDNPVCACSLVHLGWHPSVGAAVDAWIDHALSDG